MYCNIMYCMYCKHDSTYNTVLYRSATELFLYCLHVRNVLCDFTMLYCTVLYCITGPKFGCTTLCVLYCTVRSDRYVL